MRTIDDIRALGLTIFDPQFQRTFNLRVHVRIHPDGKGGAYFVTSSQTSRKFARHYTLRHTDGTNYRTVGTFGGMPTAREAHALAAAYASGERDEPCDRCGTERERETDARYVAMGIKFRAHGCPDPEHMGR